MLAVVVFVFILLFIQNSQQQTINVMKSNLRLLDQNLGMSGAKLKTNQSVILQDITICMRFKYKVLGDLEGQGTLIFIEDWSLNEYDNVNFSLLRFGAYYPLSFFSFGNPKANDSYSSFLLKKPNGAGFDVWSSNRWSHFCITYERKTSFFRVVKDGQVTNVNGSYPELTNVEIPNDFLSKIYLGRCSFDYKKSCSTPEGQITDFNIWSKALSLEEVIEITSCKTMPKGDVVNWDNAEFDSVNMTFHEENISSICKPQNLGYILLPELRNFTAHESICTQLGGKPTLMSSNQTLESLKVEFKQHSICQVSTKDSNSALFWTGWWDEPHEGIFRDIGDPDIGLESYTNIQPWKPGEPNGDRVENCVVSDIEGLWRDVSCSFQTCSLCEIDHTPDINIRGLCPETSFDVLYSWTGELINSRYMFRGYTHTLLYWEPEIKAWKLENYGDSKTFGITEGSEYPFGMHTWYFEGDHCGERSLNLSLNTCNVNEFNCNDGNCVDIQYRCDGKQHCPDKSDEIDCHMILIDSSYLRDVPPASAQKTESTLDVYVSVDILRILEIAEVENFISLQLELRLSWKDQRLTMTNLKEDKDLNTLTKQLRERIWMPEIIFYNTEDKIESLNDEKAFVIIKRNGNYFNSPIDKLQNSYIFKGEENPMTISRVYDAEFICEFNMGVYPFDTQRCSVIITLKGNRGKFVKLNIEELSYLGPIDLAQYFVKETRFTDFEVPPNKAAIKVDIIFGRRLMAAILTTYLPTVLICLVSFSTNYFRAFFFEALVAVNLTSLLVLTTLFISISDGLPKTAYLKMIDIWLIFNLIIPFAEVLLHTFIDSLRSEDREFNHHGSVMSGDAVDEFDNILTVDNDDIHSGDGEFIQLQTFNQRSLASQLTSRNEMVEVEARKRFYQNMEIKNERHMMIAMNLARKGLPFLFVSFTVAYFAIGMSYYNRGIKDI